MFISDCAGYKTMCAFLKACDGDHTAVNVIAAAYLRHQSVKDLISSLRVSRDTDLRPRCGKTAVVKKGEAGLMRDGIKDGLRWYFVKVKCHLVLSIESERKKQQ